MNKKNDFYYNGDIEDLLEKNDIRKPKKVRRGLSGWAVACIILLVLIIAASATVAYIIIKGVYSKPEVNNNGNLVSDSPVPDGSIADTAANNTYTRKDDYYTFLIVGRDSAALNTDVIMTVSYDVANGKVNIMQIPRDTFTEIDGKQYKLNAVLAKYYSKARKEGSEENYYVAGVKGLAGVISKNLNIKLDYYILLNLDGFKNIIDILGGVYMNVPRDMFYEDPEQDLYIDLKSGWQTLDGKKAEMFVRFRSGYARGDIGRVDAQKLFLSALFNSVKDNITIDKIPALVSEGIKNTITNLSVTDTMYFAKHLLETDPDNINFITMPGEGVYSRGNSGISYYVIHRYAAYEIVKEHFTIFNEELTEDLFDAKRAFTSTDNNFINDAYLKTLNEKDTYMSSAAELYDDSDR